MSNNGNLPMLPGYTFQAKKKNYGKTQYFDKQAGMSFVKEGKVAKPAIGERVPKVTRDMVVDIDNKTRKKGSTKPSKLPAWVAYDRKVLRFYCYFKETVDSSALETYRVRSCIIYYYLEDDSLHIAEPKQANSGIPQGVFVKRHKVPKPDKNGFFTANDLKVGTNIKVYGRVFRVYDCDGFTRSFYEDNGAPQGKAEECPKNMYVPQAYGQKAASPKKNNPMKKFMEAQLGKNMEGDTKRFLEHDRKVLRSFCRWDDLSMYGETMLYILHYFLADGTCEVLEVREQNSGRDHFPALLKRNKMPKSIHEVAPSIAKIGNTGENATYYTDKDFKCGEMISVFGRPIKICACDKFTKEYYISKYDYHQVADLPTDPEPSMIKNVRAPPHNGFGSQEDSLGSFLFLVPKVPRKDVKKWRENDRKELRFLAKMENPTVQDMDRRFIVTYYLSDDKVGVYEKNERNSGFIGGKFLEKCKQRNKATGTWFKAPDFYIGASVKINAYNFKLIKADEFTLKFMEGDTALFPNSDIERIHKNLCATFAGKSKQARKVFRDMDKDKDGRVSYQEFHEYLKMAGFNLNEHEVQTLCRKYDSDRDGDIDFDEFAKTIHRTMGG